MRLDLHPLSSRGPFLKPSFTKENWLVPGLLEPRPSSAHVVKAEREHSAAAMGFLSPACPCPHLPCWELGSCHLVQVELQEHETGNQIHPNYPPKSVTQDLVYSRVASGDTVRGPQGQGSGDHINYDVPSLLSQLLTFLFVMMTTFRLILKYCPVTSKSDFTLALCTINAAGPQQGPPALHGLALSLLLPCGLAQPPMP